MPRTIRRRLEAGAKKVATLAKNGGKSGAKADAVPATAAAAAAAAIARRADGGRTAQGPFDMAFTLDPAALPGVQAAAAAAAAAAGPPAGPPDADARAAAKVRRVDGGRTRRPMERAGVAAGGRAMRHEGHRLFQPAGGGQ